MTEPTLQLSPAAGSDLLYLISLLVYLGILYWFYSAIKRIERNLAEIKKKLGLDSQTETSHPK